MAYRGARMLWPLAAVALLLGASRSARADQPADFMFRPRPPGTYALVDLFTPGIQLSLENVQEIYGSANSWTNRISARISYPLGELAVHSELRILFLRLGVTGSYRLPWRNLTFAPDERLDRAHRRDRDPIFGGDVNQDGFFFVEGRAELLVPLNEHVFFSSLGALRHETRTDRTYDWLRATVHDGGLVGRWEALLWLRHRELGAIAPYVQYLNYRRDGRRWGQVALGFQAVRRVGLLRRNDLLYLMLLTRPGDGYYGQHTLRMSVNALLLYRMILDFDF